MTIQWRWAIELKAAYVPKHATAVHPEITKNKQTNKKTNKQNKTKTITSAMQLHWSGLCYPKGSDRHSRTHLHEPPGSPLLTIILIFIVTREPLLRHTMKEYYCYTLQMTVIYNYACHKRLILYRHTIAVYMTQLTTLTFKRRHYNTL